MNNLIREFPHSEDLLYTNATGATITAGSVVIVGARALIATEDIANGASGMLAGRGSFKIPKTTGEGALAVGQRLGWDAINKKATTSFNGMVAGATPGAFFRVNEAAGTNDTEVIVALDNSRRRFSKTHTVTAGEDAANQVDFVHGWGANPTGGIFAQIQAVGGTRRNPSNVTTPDVNTVRVADTGGGTLVAGDVIHVIFDE